MNTIQDFFFNNRMRHLIIVIGCFALLGVGFILQYTINLIPCPLCILQRFFFAFVGITAFIAYIQNIDGQKTKVWDAAMTVFSIIGGLVAAWQVWLQNQPKDLLGTVCAPWISSITEFIQSIFNASADCSEVTWTLLGLSIPEWSLISFIGLAIVSSLSLWRK